jgi:hypothetical protein
MHWATTEEVAVAVLEQLRRFNPSKAGWVSPSTVWSRLFELMGRYS